jgi:hypothetical protein
MYEQGARVLERLFLMWGFNYVMQNREPVERETDERNDLEVNVDLKGRFKFSRVAAFWKLLVVKLNFPVYVKATKASFLILTVAAIIANHYGIKIAKDETQTIRQETQKVSEEISLLPARLSALEAEVIKCHEREAQYQRKTDRLINLTERVIKSLHNQYLQNLYTKELEEIKNGVEKGLPQSIAR